MIMKTAMMAMPPTPDQRGERLLHLAMASKLPAAEAALCARRPIAHSAMTRGTPMQMAQARYTSTKAAPPFSPVTYGKRHMLPRPTAKPTAAIRNVKRDDQFSILPPADGPAIGASLILIILIPNQA